MHFKIKTINGRKYLYLIENQRVNGKMKQVKQIYVGSPAQVEEMLKTQKDLSIKSYPFGKAASLMYAAERIGLVDAVNGAVSKKKVPGLSVGEYVLLLISARTEGALSRARIQKWFNESLFSFLFKPTYPLSSQNCLNQMKRLDDRAMHEIENTLTRNLMELGMSPTMLIFDTTNRFSHVDKGEKLFRKGACKHKRYDKNIVGVALAVNDANMPFFSHVYPGNENDSSIFWNVFEAICQRVEDLGIDRNELTLVVDRGINSKENVQEILLNLHLVGALPRSMVEDLFRIPLSQFGYVYTTNNETDILGYETTGTYFEREFKVVVQFNEATRRRQLKKYNERKQKILSGLEDLKKSCTRTGRGRKPTEKGIINKTADIINKKYRCVFDYGITIQDNGRPCIWYEVNTTEEEKLIASFGKSAVITDKMDMSAPDLLRTYNSRWMIEDDFKWMNDKVVIPLAPFFVWKDIPVKAHVFICLLGLMLLRYLQWELKEPNPSLASFVERLDRIRMALVVDGRKKPTFMVEKLDRDSAELFTKLDMGRFIPK